MMGIVHMAGPKSNQPQIRLEMGVVSSDFDEVAFIDGDAMRRMGSLRVQDRRQTKQASGTFEHSAPTSGRISG